MGIKVKNDGLLEIATASTRKAKVWTNRRVLWSNLLDRLSVSRETDETHAEYLAFTKDRQNDVKDVGGFCGAFLNGGSRKRDAVTRRQVVTLDQDNANGNEWATYKLNYGNAACVHSTHKHTADQPRLRILIPLDRPVSPDEYEPIARRLASNINPEAVDPTCFKLHQLMYWPSHPKDITPVFEYIDAAWISADGVLATYKNWRDPAEWPRIEEEAEVKAPAHYAKSQKDPTEKPGIVGAFCRAYPVPDAIEAFLSDVYTPSDINGRYTYTEGSTAAGVIVYEDKFSFSHHSTDPASGILCNAFDLVRIRKFASEDTAEAGLPVNGLLGRRKGVCNGRKRYG